MKEWNLSTLFNLMGVGKILSSNVKLFNFLPWQKLFKKLPSDQSSNGCRVVGSPLVRGIGIAAPK
jgi:hypothetical protein